VLLPRAALAYFFPFQTNQTCLLTSVIKYISH
jgi:hypothetical protein